MTRPTRPSSADGKAGFILVAVLWILVALATFAGVYALYVSGTVAQEATRGEELNARPLARAALELTAFRLLAAPKTGRPTHGRFVFRLGKARVSVAYVEETGRIDLNAAPQAVLAGLFSALGASRTDAQNHARRIMAWRNAEDADAMEEEEALYRAAGLGYGPRGAPFVHAEELWRVAGLPPALVAAALPHVTVFSGRPRINAAIADPVVRTAAAAARPSADDADAEADARPDREDAVRVRIGIAFDSGRHRGVEAVILPGDFSDAPYRVLAWREDEEPRPAGTPGGWEEGR